MSARCVCVCKLTSIRPTLAQLLDSRVTWVRYGVSVGQSPVKESNVIEIHVKYIYQSLVLTETAYRPQRIRTGFTNN